MTADEFCAYTEKLFRGPGLTAHEVVPSVADGALLIKLRLGDGTEESHAVTCLADRVEATTTVVKHHLDSAVALSGLRQFFEAMGGMPDEAAHVFH